MILQFIWLQIRIERTPKGERGKSNNDSDFINVQFDSVNIEPKSGGDAKNTSSNQLDDLRGITATSTEFEREEFETEEELTRGEEIEQQRRGRVSAAPPVFNRGERDV